MVEEVPPPGSRSYCPRCGNEVSPTSIYCDRCGANLRNTTDHVGSKLAARRLQIPVAAVLAVAGALVIGGLWAYLATRSEDAPSTPMVTSTANPEEAFLAALQANELFPDDGMITDEALLILGDSTCEALDVGASLDSVFLGMIQMEVGGENAVPVIQAAVALCPEHAAIFDGWSGS